MVWFGLGIATGKQEEVLAIRCQIRAVGRRVLDQAFEELAIGRASRETIIGMEDKKIVC